MRLTALAALLLISCGGATSTERNETRSTVEQTQEAATNEPITVGGLSRREVMDSINDRLDSVQACYETALTHNDNVEGRIDVSWQVDEAGAVATAAMVKSTLDDADFESCVVSVVRTMKFPRGPARIRFPFVFQREQT